MRVALFGGTFDPPHRGHLAIATAAADAFALDRILFAPTGLQPLKLDTEPTPFATRLALTTAACELDPRFTASDIDAPRADGSPNYTVDTLIALAARYPRSEYTLFNLVGADSFLSLPFWHEPARLLALAEWIVVTRPGYPLAESGLAPLALTPAQRSRVHILAGVQEDVSATDLRERLRTGDPCADLLPAPVAAYIAEHRLYR
jgi:nicotinate-nucleotide adenylyltransferase